MSCFVTLWPLYHIFLAKFEKEIVLVVESWTLTSGYCFLTFITLKSQNYYDLYLIVYRYLLHTYYDLDMCVRCSLHWGRSPQNGLGDEQTCGMILALAYMLRHLSAAWLQLQMKERKSEWKWVLIGMLLLNTGDQVQWEFISVNYQTSEL